MPNLHIIILHLDMPIIILCITTALLVEINQLHLNFQAKQYELHCTIGQALVCAAEGSKSPLARDVWTSTEEEFKVLLSFLFKFMLSGTAYYLKYSLFYYSNSLS